jgi:hypothetical protein
MDTDVTIIHVTSGVVYKHFHFDFMLYCAPCEASNQLFVPSFYKFGFHLFIYFISPFHFIAVPSACFPDLRNAGNRVM